MCLCISKVCFLPFVSNNVRFQETETIVRVKDNDVTLSLTELSSWVGIGPESDTKLRENSFQVSWTIAAGREREVSTNKSLLWARRKGPIVDGGAQRSRRLLGLPALLLSHCSIHQRLQPGLTRASRRPHVSQRWVTAPVWDDECRRGFLQTLWGPHEDFSTTLCPDVIVFSLHAASQRRRQLTPTEELTGFHQH